MMRGPEHFFDTPAPKGRPPKYPVRNLAVGETTYFPGVSAYRVAASIRQHKPLKFECTTIVKAGMVHAKVTRIA